MNASLIGAMSEQGMWVEFTVLSILSCTGNGRIFGWKSLKKYTGTCGQGARGGWERHSASEMQFQGKGSLKQLISPLWKCWAVSACSSETEKRTLVEFIRLIRAECLVPKQSKASLYRPGKRMKNSLKPALPNECSVLLCYQIKSAGSGTIPSHQAMVYVQFTAFSKMDWSGVLNLCVKCVQREQVYFMPWFKSASPGMIEFFYGRTVGYAVHNRVHLYWTLFIMPF